MKRTIFVFTVLMAILLQGCIVRSLYPFYTEGDVVFKKELLHAWVDQDNNRWEIKPFKEKANAYEMHLARKGEDDVVFLVHLFKINDAYFFDFLPLSNGDTTERSLTADLFVLHMMPTHSIAKVDMLSAGEVRIKWFNEGWLRSLFDQNRIKISHEVIYDEAPENDKDKLYILTASPEELQKFILKYGNDDAAFDNENTIGLILKRAV